MRFIRITLAALLMTGAAGIAAAQEPEIRREVRVLEHPGMMHGTMLSIAAEGSVQGRPDMAAISVGVMTEGATAAAALAENGRRMNALMSAVRRAGLAERDVQTSNLSVNPQHVYVENESPRITGYQAHNMVTLRVRNVDNLGRVIDAAVGAGGNNVNGVSFSYQEPDAQWDAARRDAMTEARRLAELYASAIGASIERVVSISEGGAAPPPMPMMRMERMAMANDASTPTAPGEVETRVTVNVVYELK
jgi:uncharacterized protein YggE